jgi:hypothetical protein
MVKSTAVRIQGVNWNSTLSPSSSSMGIVIFTSDVASEFGEIKTSPLESREKY